VKYLDEIPTFPTESARLLESRYGIATAEAFCEHALHEPLGLRTALGLKTKADLDKLITLVEGHLTPSFVRGPRLRLSAIPEAPSTPAIRLEALDRQLDRCSVLFD
jgi:hypothetical protein